MSLTGKYKHVTATSSSDHEAPSLVITYWLGESFTRQRQSGARRIEIDGVSCLTTYDVPLPGTTMPHVLMEAIAADMRTSNEADVHSHIWCQDSGESASDTREIAEWRGDMVPTGLDQWAVGRAE